MRFDRDAYRELDLWIDNTELLYRRKMALGKNYAGRIEKGKYDRRKARKGIFNLVVVPAARQYDKEFGSGNKSIFDRSTREAVAKSHERQLFKGILNKEYDFATPKKYKGRRKTKVKGWNPLF